MADDSLSLPARLYLLAWDTARGEAADSAHLPHLVRAGALIELARRGLLTDEDGIATPVDLDALTGDAVLDGLLELVRESLPHRWRSWVTLHTRVTLDAVREQLAADGYLRAGKRRVFGVFPAVEYAVRRPGFVDALHEEARQMLTGPVPVAEVAERDAAVVTLAAAAGLRTLLPAEGLGPHRQRVEELAERSGAAAHEFRHVIREVRTAVTVPATEVASAGSQDG